jgi:hypothetical protein
VTQLYCLLQAKASIKTMELREEAKKYLVNNLDEHMWDQVRKIKTKQFFT